MAFFKFAICDLTDRRGWEEDGLPALSLADRLEVLVREDSAREAGAVLRGVILGALVLASGSLLEYSLMPSSSTRFRTAGADMSVESAGCLPLSSLGLEEGIICKAGWADLCALRDNGRSKYDRTRPKLWRQLLGDCETQRSRASTPTALYDSAGNFHSKIH